MVEVACSLVALVVVGIVGTLGYFVVLQPVPKRFS